MVYGAIDLHMRYSQIRIIDEAGVGARDQRVLTTRERSDRRSRASGRCGFWWKRGPRVSGWRRRSRPPGTR